MSIPKTIHYCWYGNGEKPECFRKCYDSWKKYAPDYEIIEWNEQNTNLSENLFMAQAMEAKNYPFVSDIARFRVVYDHGGVYLDTDVELKQSLDELLQHSAFFFFDAFGKIGTGFGFGAEAGDPVVGRLLSDYNSQTFSADRVKTLLSTNLNTSSLVSCLEDFHDENRTQLIGNYAFLSTYDYARFALHHYTATWRSEEDLYADRFRKKHWPFRKYYGFLRSPKIFAFFHRHRLRKAERLYSFFVYDFLIYGLRYYAYKLLRKVQNRLPQVFSHR